jgi:hypothetical protein
VCVHRPPQQRRKKERKKLDDEKIDENPGKISIIQKHPTKGEKGKEQIKRTPSFVKRFLF